MTHWNYSLFFLILLVKDYSRSSLLCDLLILFQISAFSHDDFVPICSCASWYFSTNSSNPSQVFTPDVFIGNNPPPAELSCLLCKEDQILVCIKFFYLLGLFHFKANKPSKQKKPQIVELLICWEQEKISTLGNYKGGVSKFGTEALSKNSLGYDTIARLIFKHSVWQLAAVERWVGFLPDQCWCSKFGDKHLPFRIHRSTGHSEWGCTCGLLKLRLLIAVMQSASI